MKEMNGDGAATAATEEHAAWEARCKRCGFCCFEKFENENGTIFYTQTPCRYLDVVTRECKVYERRFSINPECVQLTPQLAASLKWLHPDCAYKQKNEND